jgi:DnaJ-domain-containing protein 1
MHLPGRLRTTTLGDLLGTLHRARATGTLELAEFHGRTHRVHLSRGLVVAVELDGPVPSLAEELRREGAVADDVLKRSLLRAIASRRLHGEVLVRDFKLSPALIDTALRRQLLTRLGVIERLSDAQLLFRVTVRPPRGALLDDPLRPPEFLSGRRRLRAHQDRSGSGAANGRATPPPSAARRQAPRAEVPTVDPRQLAAHRVLGVPFGADAIVIKRAYRQLARNYHPDLHPLASEAERRALAERFVEVTAAYQTLVA